MAREISFVEEVFTPPIEILVSDGFLSIDTNTSGEWIGLDQSLKKRKGTIDKYCC